MQIALRFSDRSGKLYPGMFERFTDRSRKIMALACRRACRQRSPAIEPRHIMLGLLQEGRGVGAHVLRDMGVDLARLEAEIMRAIGTREADAPVEKLPQTTPAKRVIEGAIDEAREMNHKWVGSEHLLLGLLLQEDPTFSANLRASGVNVARAREGVLQLLGPREASATPDAHAQARQRAVTPKTPRPSDDAARDFPPDRVSASAARTLSLAYGLAKDRRAPAVSPAHLLFAIAFGADGVAANVLASAGSPDRMGSDLRKRLGGEGAFATRGRGPDVGCLVRHAAAAEQARRQFGDELLRTEHLLLAFLRAPDAAAEDALRACGVDPAVVESKLVELLGQTDRSAGRPGAVAAADLRRASERVSRALGLETRASLFGRAKARLARLFAWPLGRPRCQAPARK